MTERTYKKDLDVINVVSEIFASLQMILKQGGLDLATRTFLFACFWPVEYLQVYYL